MLRILLYIRLMKLDFKMYQNFGKSFYVKYNTVVQGLAPYRCHDEGKYWLSTVHLATCTDEGPAWVWPVRAEFLQKHL